MFDLDIRTLAIVGGVSSLIPAIALYFQPGAEGETGRDRICWTLGFLALFAGWNALGLRGVIADILSVLAGNMLLVLGYALILNGIRNHVGGSAGLWLPFAIMAAFLGVFGAAYAVEAGYNARVLIIGLFSLGLSGASIVTLHRAARRFRSRVMQVGEGIFLILFTITAVRMLVSLGGPAFTFEQAGPVHTLSFLVYSMTNIALGMTFLAMLAQRLQRELQREIDTRERLLALIGHDLRSPFNAILGGLQAMDIYARKGQKDKILETAHTVGAAARKVYELLETLLAWARTRPGLEIEADRVDLHAVIGHVAGFFESAISAKSLDLEMRLGVGEIHTDRRALETILRNLLSNAVKFSPQNGRIVVESSMSGGRVSLVVRDQGAGMPDYVLRHLALGEYSNSATGTSGESGAGMGLRLSMDLARSLGGHLRATNCETGGASLELVVPLERARTPEILH